ncbi:MAG: GNAT family N-acetyltransferase [Gammaproteobacteria bacterium]|nr:GNAT family N-acetyltransferase [Gammaproteobacteria bacterium]MCW9004179.1 GNAT family N-acetyltransferase [Gammaproteobacteria bacterium]
MSPEYKIIKTSWKEDRQALSQVRRKVFIEEQKVPEELEWDEFDETSHHVLALDSQNNPIGTGRIKPDGQIGRMAVLKNWRNKSVGKAILEELLKIAIRSNYPETYLHAQLTAIKFYEKSGFIVNSDEFMDAGIPHKTMIKRFVN